MSTKKGIHIVAMEIRNMYRIRFARVKFIPGVGFVRVTGDNGEGKTSVIRAAMACFGGASEVLSSALNDQTDGEPGYAVMELSNGYTVRRDITEANPKGSLRVIGPDGGKHGQKKLNGWLGDHHDFDVLAFFGLKPPRQREILLGLGKDPDLASKLATKREAHEALYEERTPIIAEQRRARAVSKPDGERPDQVDISAEMEKLRELQGAHDRRRTVAVELDSYRAKLATNKARMTEITETQLRFVAKTNEDIQGLKDQLATLEELHGQQTATHEDERDKLTTQRTELMTAGKATKATFEAMADVSDAIDAATAHISDTDAVNERLAPWKSWDRAEQDLETAQSKYEELTLKMQAIEADETALIAEAGIPVEGISFSENAEPLLNGRPLDVASGAERIRMAVAVAIAEDPELRVCLIDEANDLGLKAMEELDRQATDHDFQIIGCRLGIEGPGEIVVNDGLAWSKGDEDAVAEEGAAPLSAVMMRSHAPAQVPYDDPEDPRDLPELPDISGDFGKNPEPTGKEPDEQAEDDSDEPDEDDQSDQHEDWPEKQTDDPEQDELEF